MRRALLIVVIAVPLFSVFGHASATLFLEEPYGKLGFFTATGHAAVYLSGVCAETPVKLRPCAPGETGIVISRYDAVGGYDWIAIPLIPYLYAVERPQDVPLFADAKMALFLRDRYRRKYLEEIAPDRENSETPGGNWYQLVGSSYDRTIYGFEIETTPEQDAALIRKLKLVAERIALSPGVKELRRLRERYFECLFPQDLSPERGCRLGDDDSQADGKTDDEVCGPSPGVAVLQDRDRTGAGYDAAKHGGAWRG